MSVGLFLKKNGRVVEYHEAFYFKSKIRQHWGKLGEEGECSARPRNKKVSEEQDIEDALASARAKGFKEIPEEKYATILIEYRIEGMGTESDVEKINELFDVLQDVLGLTGLGHSDGNSIGSGTMEAVCFVVDAAVAKRVIAKALKGTKFGDYTRIYKE